MKYVDKKSEDFRIFIEKEFQDYSKITSDYEEWIHRLEYETNWMRKQKEAEEYNKFKAEGELQKYRQLHDRDIAVWNKTFLEANMDKWVLVSKGLLKIKLLKDNVMINDLDHAQRLRVAIDDFNDCKGKMSLQIETLESAVSGYRERLMSIYDTIMHHKRDSLIRQRSSSNDLSLKLNAIKAEKETLEIMRNQLNKQLSSLEDNINDVERRIREHCNISVIQGGMVNEVHTGRKKRLDEECVVYIHPYV